MKNGISVCVNECLTFVITCIGGREMGVDPVSILYFETICKQNISDSANQISVALRAVTILTVNIRKSNDVNTQKDEQH